MSPTMAAELRSVAFLVARNILKSFRTPMLVTFSLLQPMIWLVMFSQTFRAGRHAGVPCARLSVVPDLLRPGHDCSLGAVHVAPVGDGHGYRYRHRRLRQAPDQPDSPVNHPARQGHGRRHHHVHPGDPGLAAGAPVGCRRARRMAGATALLAIAVFFGVVWASLSNLIALRTRNSELTMVVGLFATLPTLFLSSAFFPRQLLPGWLRAVAKVNPAAYVIQTGQQLMNTGNDWGQDLATLLAIVITGIIFIRRWSTRSGHRPSEDQEIVGSSSNSPAAAARNWPVISCRKKCRPGKRWTRNPAAVWTPTPPSRPRVRTGRPRRRTRRSGSPAGAAHRTGTSRS